MSPACLNLRPRRAHLIVLANVRPERSLFSITATMGVFEVLAVISIRTADPSGILLQAIDDCLRNGRFICRHVRGKMGIRHVEDKKVTGISPGLPMARRPHGWSRGCGKLARAAWRADPRREKLR